ncbi:hypothetical protein [uncultured Algibacter sp.]|uniref:hypothetical protein n=1 Tax=uncultured Algibacter sp. TaxID=298659 RepID=UPI0030EE35CC|tara:strand:- start:2791 stop:3738 length:948 start_codon:yes stop_codon:yes gene_type:complete
MKKLFVKSTLYLFLIIIALEVFVRAFHLYTETPVRYIDEFNVEKSLSNQTGHAVTGNRKQNYSEYRINGFGFNSFREFTPTEEKIEVALIGDSFIEGFHQDYFDSTGRKIENILQNIEIYEYGYGGYDLANQLYLVHTYKEHFDKIDHIIFYLKYENDLKNNTYVPNHSRIALLKSLPFRIRDNFKLLSYASSIGIVNPIKKLAISIMNGKKEPRLKHDSDLLKEELENLKNFKTLLDTLGFDKNKMTFLLNSTTTNHIFLNYCNEKGYQVIDFSDAFEKSINSPTLIYDMHWNNHGRDLIAFEISNYLKTKLSL